MVQQIAQLVLHNLQIGTHFVISIIMYMNLLNNIRCNPQKFKKLADVRNYIYTMFEVDCIAFGTILYYGIYPIY